MIARRRALGAALLSLAMTTGLVAGVSTPAQAAGPQVFGRVTDAHTGKAVRTVKVLLFTEGWTYVKRVKVRRNGVYQLDAPAPGRYHLQFVDGRPAYKTDAYAARLDVPVSIGSRPAQKNVRLKIGGAIGGTVKVRGKRASGARIRAVSNGGQVIEVAANKRGEYALGGLAKDDYRVFAYDKSNRRVGKSKLVRKVRLRTFRKASFDLRTRPAWIRGFLTLDGERARATVYVTAVNRRTGEYWVQRVRGGNISLKGLTPGRYTLQVPDTQGYYGRSFNLGTIRAGSIRNKSVDLTTRGGTVSGQAVDKDGAGIPNISVRLTDARGQVQAEKPTNQDGTFTIGGSIRQQGGMTLTIFAYSTIQGHTYEPRTFTGVSLVDNRTQWLGQVVVTREPDPAKTTATPTTPTSSPTPPPATTSPAPVVTTAPTPVA